MEQTFLVGLDLGQAQDFSALVILQRILGDMTAPPTYVSYALRFLKRFPLRTPYPDIIDGVRMVVSTEQLAHKCVLLVDATGVGKPIVDVLQRAKLPVKLVPVVITGGSVVVRDGSRYNVPKRDLATAVKILLDGRRLRISTQLAQHELLTKELEAFRVKINTKTANDSYEAWREGDHDDLVLSVALCCWYAERGMKKMFEGEADVPQTENRVEVRKINDTYSEIIVHPPVETPAPTWTWDDLKGR